LVLTPERASLPEKGGSLIKRKRDGEGRTVKEPGFKRVSRVCSKEQQKQRRDGKKIGHARLSLTEAAGGEDNYRGRHEGSEGKLRE